MSAQVRWRSAVLLLAASAAGCGDGGRQQVRAVAGIALLDPQVLDFGDVALGLEGRRTALLRNAGPVSLSVVDLAQLTGGPSAANDDFEVSGLPATLGAGDSKLLELRYHPRRTGLSARAVALSTDSPDGRDLTLDLRGRAVLGLAELSVDVLDFGAVLLGQQSALSFTLSNNDGHAETRVQVPPAQGPAAGAFSVSPSGSVPMAANQSLAIEVRFGPGLAGDHGAQIDLVPCPTCKARPVLLRGSGVTHLLKVDPSAIDFGLVVVGQKVTRPFSLTNLSREPLGLTGLTATGDRAFTLALDGAAPPLQLAPGQTITGTATFAPREYRLRSATAAATVSRGGPSLLALSGTGVGPKLVPRPAALYVGPAVPNTTRTKNLAIANGGYDPRGNQLLVVTSVSLQSGEPATWGFRAPPLPWTVGGPGSAGTIVVSFSPQGAGFSRATLTLGSNDPLRPVVNVPLSALGRILPPCTPRIEPSGTVDFGAIHVLQPSVQGFELINDGEQDCLLGDPEIVSGTPEFSWPGNVQPSGRTLPPGGRMSVRVRFVPPSERTYQARVEMYLSNPAMPRLAVALQGEGDARCFVLTPGTLGFGSTANGCGVLNLTAYAHNWCAGPVRVEAVSINRPQFTLANGPALPVAIPPNGVLPLTVRYQPPQPGDDVAALSVTASTRATPYNVGLTAGAQPDKTIHDAWDQSTPKVDLLLVIDNSASMATKLPVLQSNLGSLWNRIALANAEFHIAVTTTGMSPYTANWTQCPGGAAGGEAGRFFPVDASRPRILTPQTPNLKDVLSANVDVGACHWDERMLEPIVAALTPPLIDTAKAPGTPWPADGNAGFLRDDARLGLLVVTDTDDDAKLTNPPPVSGYVQRILSTKRGVADMVSFAALVPLSNCPAAEMYPVPRLQETARALGGQLFDLCDLNNLGPTLDRAADTLLQPQSSFPLSARPYDPDQIAVAVDGVQAGGWIYDPGPNRIVFAPTSVPLPGSHITAEYVSACR
jgi:hypothetical protein